MNQFSEEIKFKADTLCSHFLANTPYFNNNPEEQVTHLQVATYVQNLEHLFFKNCVDIKWAADLYSHDERISSFFRNKWNEENGHDKWAKSDLTKMQEARPELKQIYILPEMTELTNFLHGVMKTSPSTYIAYMYYAEYMTAKVGPVLMNTINRSLGLKKQEVSALNNHIELDGDHASEVAEFLDSLDLRTEERAQILEFGNALFEKYQNFFISLKRLENAQ